MHMHDMYSMWIYAELQIIEVVGMRLSGANPFVPQKVGFCSPVVYVHEILISQCTTYNFVFYIKHILINQNDAQPSGSKLKITG